MDAPCISMYMYIYLYIYIYIPRSDKCTDSRWTYLGMAARPSIGNDLAVSALVYVLSSIPEI